MLILDFVGIITNPKKEVKMNQTLTRSPRVPRNFIPPIVLHESQGVDAFYAYDWYFNYMKEYLKDVERVFLTPCAKTKPIHKSHLHRSIYQKYIKAKAAGSVVLVVSEPVVLIHYPDLEELENCFLYDFPINRLSLEARELFIERLWRILGDKDIEGCLPSHHASLINEAVGFDWKNYWEGDMLDMKKRASQLR